MLTEFALHKFLRTETIAGRRKRSTKVRLMSPNCKLLTSAQGTCLLGWHGEEWLGCTLF